MEKKVNVIHGFVRRNVPNVKIAVVNVLQTEEGVTVNPALAPLKRKVGCFVATNESGRVNIGYSLCMVKPSNIDKAGGIAPDEYNEQEGIRRAKEKLSGNLVLPVSIRKDFRKFLKRCEKYYKEDCVFEDRVLNALSSK